MILSVDPGRDKTGCAVVEEDGSLVVKKVIPTKDYEKEMACIMLRRNVKCICYDWMRIFRRYHCSG